MNEWKFGGPLTRAQTLRAEGDRIMAQADELREAMIHAEREVRKLEILAITAWAKAETLEAQDIP